MSILSSSPSIWLKNFRNDAEKHRVQEIGNLTGLKENAGNYQGLNFERALLLRQIIRERRPQNILELGTGRGLGSLAMADVLEKENIPATITTVDIFPPTLPQRWPVFTDGKYATPMLCINEVWNTHFPDLRKRITLETGCTTAVLPRLLSQKRAYDFIFIDAGHDVYSVFHDFVYSTMMLTVDGCMLMDDFTPLEPYGVATCIAASHAHRYYEMVEILETEGVLFEPLVKEMSRGMVFLDRKKKGDFYVNHFLLQINRWIGRLIEQTFRPGFFPLKIKE